MKPSRNPATLEEYSQDRTKQIFAKIPQPRSLRYIALSAIVGRAPSRDWTRMGALP